MNAIVYAIQKIWQESCFCFVRFHFISFSACVFAFCFLDSFQLISKSVCFLQWRNRKICHNWYDLIKKICSSFRRLIGKQMQTNKMCKTQKILFYVLSRSKRLYKNMLKEWFNVKQTLNFNLAISIHNNFCVLPKKKQNSLFVHTTWSSCLFYIYAKE